MNTVILTMGGSGTRFGADIPKQFTLIDDVPIFAYLLKKINDSNIIDRIVIVTNGDFVDYTKEWVEKISANKVYNVVIGGSSRSESVFNGLKCVKEYANDNDIVLIHDATHPYFDYEGTEKVVGAIDLYDAASLVSCEYDTVYLQDEHTNFIESEIPKKKVVVGASPEGFKFGKIYEIYANTPYEDLEYMSSAGVLAIENNMKLKAIPTSILNIKITYPEDMKLFLELFGTYFFKEEQKNIKKLIRKEGN